jgi:hypothetical protein
MVLVFAAVAVAGPGDDPLKKFNGEWVRQGGGGTQQGVGEAQKFGLPIPERGEPAATLKIDGRKWTLTGGKMPFSGNLTAKAGDKFHEIDLVIDKGDKRDAKFLGLIHDYKNGTWELALNFPGSPRPQSPDKAALRYVWKPAK